MTLKRLTQEERDAAIENALNAACFEIQKALGQTDGGVAGIYFSGPPRDEFKDIFERYIDLELCMGCDEPETCATRFRDQAATATSLAELAALATSLGGILSETGDEDHDCYYFQGDGSSVAIHRSTREVELLA